MKTTPQSSFLVKRLLPASPAHAYRFWSDPALRRRWTDCHPDWSALENTSDFRVGGHERQRQRAPDGLVQQVDTHYLDLIPGERIVYAYAMQINAAPLSASLVTIDLVAEGKQTRMTFAEHLSLLDGSLDIGQRELGTGDALDMLVKALQTA